MRIRNLARSAALLSAFALVLTGCDSEDVTPEVETPEASESEVESSEPDAGEEGPAEFDMAALDLVSDGTLTVCSDIPYPPFEDFDADGNAVGFDITLVGNVADDLGLELEVLAQSFDGIQSGAVLASRTCDVAVSAMTITEEREENLDFSDSYLQVVQSLLVKKDSGITTLADFPTDEQLGVQSATTGQDYATENAPDGVGVVEFAGAGELFTALDAGTVSGILQDEPVNGYQTTLDDTVEIVETFDTAEEYGFAVAEDGRDALLEAINTSLAAQFEDGRYSAASLEWFGTDLLA